MNTKSEHTDLFGRPINVGDYIVYSASDGRLAIIRIGQVIKLTSSPKNKWDNDSEKVAKVFCKSWSNFRSEGWNHGEERSGRQKNVTLHFLTRVVVVDPATVSEKIKKDLNGPVCGWDGKPIGE